MTFINIFFIFCFVTFASCGPVENKYDNTRTVPEKCSEGQEIWCKNFISAVECKAENHCLQTVWLTTKNLNIGDACSDCEQKIDDIKTAVDSNFTKQVLRELLSNICNPVYFVRETCEALVNQYVDDYLNELLDLIKSGVDSETLCHILQFCATQPSALPTVFQDDAVVYFKNIILHLPARFINTEEAPKLVGSQKCTWGPSYWCNNVTCSKECKSTTHCINSVWSKTHFDEDNDSVCKVCKDMIKQARDQLLSNETQEELREVFEGSCKLIPIKEIQKECIELADEFVPELTEMVASQLNPTAVCTVVGLCNNARIDNLLSASVALSNDVLDSCSNCTTAFMILGRYLRNSSRSEIIDKLLRICSELSSYSDGCSDLVNSHFDEIYPIIVKQLRPFAACHLSGMCASRFHIHSPSGNVDFEKKIETALITPNDDLPCDLCKQLVKHFKDILVANTTEDEFHQVLKGLCAQTGKFKDECLQLVEDNFANIYKFLTEELNPIEICREVNLCPSGTMINDESLNLISKPLVLQISDSSKIVSMVSSETQTEIQNFASPECQFCKTIVKLIQTEIKKPKFKNDIRAAIEHVCTLVPHSDKSKCQHFVDENIDDLIKLLTDQSDAGLICSMLDVCTSITDQEEKISGNDLCPFCQYIMHFIENELDNPKEEKKIEDVVKKICELIPKAEKGKCMEFISQYSALIISVLAEELDPSTVCPALKLCPGSQSPLNRCMHCQTLMRNLISDVNENREEANIKNKLKNLVPAQHSDITEVALELKINYYEDLIEMMMAEFSSVESCIYLRFCDAKTVQSIQMTGSVETNEISDSVIATRAPHRESEQICDNCEMFVEMYENELTSNITETEMEEKMSSYCEKLEDEKSASSCIHFTYKYVPVLMTLLKININPKELCGLAKLCPLRTPKNFDFTSMEECHFCEAVVGSLQSISQDPYIESSTTAEAHKICDMFKTQGNLCSEIVNELVPQLETIVTEIPSWFYCAKIKMCPYNAHFVDPDVCLDKLLWCEDMKTAVFCDKVKYCQVNVWKSEKPSLN